MDPIKGRVSTFDVTNGVGEILLADGRVARFGASRIGYDGDLRALTGLPVEVTELVVGPGGRLRVATARIDLSELTRVSGWADAQPRARLQVARCGAIGPEAVIAGTAGPDLVLVLVLATLSSRHEYLVLESDIARWAVAREDALGAAKVNLRRLGALRQLRSGTYAVEGVRGYAAACLLQTELLDTAQTSGPPVVFVPHRDHAFVTGTDDQVGLQIACRLAQSALLADLDQHVRTRDVGGSSNAPATAGALTGRASVRLGAEWFLFEPSSHPLEGELLALRQLADAIASNQQKARLDAMRDARDVHIASVLRGFLENPGALYTVWTEDTPTWLPAAPAVAFVTRHELDEGVRNRPLVLVPWERVQAELGTSMRALGLQPERWEVRSFPTSEVLGRLEGGGRS